MRSYSSQDPGVLGALFCSVMNFRERGPPLERSRKVMKNEYKIDYVSIPDEGDMGLQSFGNNRGGLERGLKSARAGPEQIAQILLF